MSLRLSASALKIIMNIKLSIIIPTLDGSIRAKIPEREDVEIVVVKGVCPVGKARNEGLRRAKGEYIAWVDSDDEVEEGWLEEILGVLTQRRRDAESARPEGSSERTGADLRGTAAPEGVDVVTFDAELVGWNGRPDYVWGVKEKDATIERLKRDVYRDITRPSALWLYVTKRELWEGLKFDETVRTAEDYLIFTQVIERAKSCKYIPKKLYRYIRNEGSLVNSQPEGQVLKDFEIQRQQIARAPKTHRGEMIWGAGLNMFWLLRRVKTGETAEYARRFLCEHLGTLLKATWFSGDFTLFDKLRCTARFVVGALWRR